MVDLSVVIVNWNVGDLLRRCLQSIRNPTAQLGSERPTVTAPAPCASDLELETIVVDNGSSDGSVTMVRENFPDVRIIANEDNRGFPAANNQGMAVAQGRHILLLNPDTEIVGGALATMVTFADQHPDVGMVGPQLLNPDGTIQPSRRRFPTLATAVLESTWLQPYAPRQLLARYYVSDQPTDIVQQVDWITGAAMLARRTAVEQVGPMDGDFFMYSEELDWCRRFAQSGWRVVYLPTAQIIHHVGKSSEQAVGARHIHFQTSKVRYFRKHHGALAAKALRWFILMNYVWQLIVEGAKWLVGHRRPLRAQRIAAYRQVLTSRLRC